MKKYAITSAALPQKCRDFLEGLGFSVIALPSFEKLARPVASHPDMLLFFGDKIFCHSEYYAKNAPTLELISRLSCLGIVTTDEKISDKYPCDILFNALPLGKYVFCKAESVSRLIKDYAERNALELVNTRQGYARCSVCKVSENAIITADTGIYESARARGIDSLLISEGNIDIDGYSYGFIGGTSGVFGDTVYFCGDLSSHPDGEKIKSFCKSHEKNAVSLSDGKLYDVGTLFFFEDKK